MSDMIPFDQEAFAEYEKFGFSVDYIKIDYANNVIRPAFGTAQQLIDSGWLPKGSVVTFLNKNGYDGERLRAAAVFAVGDPLTIKRTHIGRSSSDYEFEDVEGKWNTVMFGKLEEAQKLQKSALE